ncbi:MAG: hypothetical protein IAF58_20715 [Leptolyngbya sp.]|nr:hypothetical protein [Candidatus Melainabacteria bacterium]
MTTAAEADAATQHEAPDELDIDKTNAAVSLIMQLKTKTISAKKRLNIIPVENMLVTMIVFPPKV